MAVIQLRRVCAAALLGLLWWGAGGAAAMGRRSTLPVALALPPVVLSVRAANAAMTVRERSRVVM